MPKGDSLRDVEFSRKNLVHFFVFLAFILAIPFVCEAFSGRGLGYDTRRPYKIDVRPFLAHLWAYRPSRLGLEA